MAIDHHPLFRPITKATLAEVERLPDGGIPVPGGYVIRPTKKE